MINTIWIVLIAIFWLPAVIITELPLIFSKDKYTMDYIMMLLGLVPVLNIITAICSIFCMGDEWRSLANKFKRQQDYVH